MLDKTDLRNIASLKRLSLSNTEKDYLLELVLYHLSLEVGRKLVFKGGTALYKLHGLNRFSEDLDFTFVSSFNIDKVLQKIIAQLSRINMSCKVKEATYFQNQKNILLEIRGPLFDGNPKTLSFLPINISVREKPLYEPEQKKLYTVYQDITSFDVFAMPLGELFAEKIRAILTRKKARDIYDAWFLLMKGVQVNIGDINKKMSIYKKKFLAKELLSRLDEAEKNWEKELQSLIIGTLPHFSLVKKEIMDKFL